MDGWGKVMGRTSLSAVFPAYNDQHTIGGMVRTVAAELKKVTDDFEVLVVNDASTDGSQKWLLDFQKQHSRLRVIENKPSEDLL